jgi:transcriptional regulator with XRE-family HTH domain
MSETTTSSKKPRRKIKTKATTSKSIPPYFGPTVRSVREEKGLGLRELARAVSLSPTFVSKFERAEMPPPSVEKIMAIAEILEINPDELLGRANKLPPDVVEILKRRPSEMARLVRWAANIDSHKVDELTSSV